MTEIAEGACSGIKKLTSLTIGKNVTTVGKDAFEDCVNLKTVSGGSAVESIGGEAFENCKSLEAFTLGENVKKIGEEAFNKCGKLAQITVKTKLLTAKNVGKNAFGNICKEAEIKCPKGMKEAYEKLFRAKGAPEGCIFK